MTLEDFLWRLVQMFPMACGCFTLGMIYRDKCPAFKCRREVPEVTEEMIYAAFQAISIFGHWSISHTLMEKAIKAALEEWKNEKV